MPFSPTDTLEAAFPWVVAWGVPVAYLVLCVAMSLGGKRLVPPAPDEVPATPDVPGMHPVLLGALRCHEESEFTDERNAYGIALATVVRMIGRGAATFTARGRTARATALSYAGTCGGRGSSTAGFGVSSKAAWTTFARRGSPEGPARSPALCSTRSSTSWSASGACSALPRRLPIPTPCSPRCRSG